MPSFVRTRSVMSGMANSALLLDAAESARTLTR
jgi:hypothetical protein